MDNFFSGLARGLESGQQLAQRKEALSLEQRRLSDAEQTQAIERQSAVFRLQTQQTQQANQQKFFSALPDVRNLLQGGHYNQAIQALSAIPSPDAQNLAQGIQQQRIDFRASTALARLVSGSKPTPELTDALAQSPKAVDEYTKWLAATRRMEHQDEVLKFTNQFRGAKLAIDEARLGEQKQRDAAMEAKGGKGAANADTIPATLSAQAASVGNSVATAILPNGKTVVDELGKGTIKSFSAGLAADYRQQALAKAKQLADTHGIPLKEALTSVLSDPSFSDSVTQHFLKTHVKLKKHWLGSSAEIVSPSEAPAAPSGAPRASSQAKGMSAAQIDALTKALQ